MQWRNSALAALVVAASSVMVAGCGEEEAGETACTDTSQCGENQICHPFAKVCVQTCNSGADCPEEARTCGTIDLGNGQQSERFCQCATDELCGGGVGSSNVCSSSQDRICTVQCGTDEACGPGRRCNDLGHCVNRAAGATCDNSQPEPAGCSYGQFCSGDTGAGACQPVATPDPAVCPNFNAHGTTWNPASSTGPVIYEVTTDSVATGTGGFCGGTTTKTRHRLRVKAYRLTGTFPETDRDLESQLHFVRTNGTEGPTLNTVQDLTVFNGGKNAEFIFNLCDEQNLGQIVVGLHFEPGGNPACHVSDNPAALIAGPGY